MCHIYFTDLIPLAAWHSLKVLTSPLLILHAEDDNVIPHHMGRKVAALLFIPALTKCTLLPPGWRTLYCCDRQLHQISLQTQESRRTQVPVQMVSYGAELGFSHNNIYLDADLTSVVRYVLPTVSFLAPLFSSCTVGTCCANMYIIQGNG